MLSIYQPTCLTHRFSGGPFKGSMNPQNVFIIRNDRLGDLILSLPVAETLKKYLPGSTVTYLVSPGPAQIRAFVPYVDDWILDGDSENRLGLLKLQNVIRRGRFDCVIELKPSLRTAMAGYVAGVPVRIGTARRGFSLLYNRRVNVHRKGSGKHQTDLDLEMLEPLSIQACGVAPNLTITSSSIERAKLLIGMRRKRYIVIHPGSGGSAPNWPLEYYRELAHLAFESTDCAIVITGNNDAIGFFEDRYVNLNGKTDLEVLAGIIAGADLFVSGSTGPLHLADSLGVRCMSFFVNHSVIGPERWGPRSNLENVITPPGESCRCEDVRKCNCLTRISPRAALDRMLSILNS